MYYDRSKYEKLIKESPLFTLDRETENSAYKREKLKMVEYLYCYLLSINERGYEPYGKEIIEVAGRCIVNFDTSKGEFLHYFNSAWKQEYRHIMGDIELEKQYRGIKLTEEEKRDVKKYSKAKGENDTGYSKGELYEKVSRKMGVSVEKIQHLDQLSNLHVSGNVVTNSEGEEADLWDTISDGQSIESQLEDEESIEELLFKIEETFNHLQDRQKPIVSDMITVRIWDHLFGAINIEKYNFVSKDVCEEFARTRCLPNQRQIAEKHHKNEASVSRTLKEFLKKLKLNFTKD